MGPTIAQIYHQNLIHNLNLIKQAVKPAWVMGVVKANAYGHASIEVSETLLKSGANYLGVAFAEEGIELREGGISCPILVFGAQLDELFEDQVRHNLEITVTAEYQIKTLVKLSLKVEQKIKIHLKVDTGMNRVGILPNQVPDLLNNILSEPTLQLSGIYTHFSSADEDDPDYTMLQLKRLNNIKQQLNKLSTEKVLFHAANSAAIMKFPETYYDMVRPGVMLYGNPPGPDFKLTWDLKEVMRLTSKVALIKELGQNEPISYNRRYYTKNTTQVAVIPIGYADGFNRRFTNTGEVLIRGKRYPIRGTVCMDQIVVELGKNKDIKVGDEVVLFGRQGDARISIIDISRQLQTIPYEVTCWISNRVPRTHIYNDSSGNS